MATPPPRKRRIGLRTKLIGSILALFLLTYLANTYLSVRTAQTDLRETLQNNLVRQTDSESEILRSELREARNVATSLAALAEASQLDPDTQKSILENTVRDHPIVYGSAIAYEPDAFEDGRYYWSPYYSRLPDNADEIVYTQLGTPEYNYFEWMWYTVPKAEERPVISRPYFDRGGGEIWMVTWSVPFFDEAGAVKGVATADVAFAGTQALVRDIEVGRGGYAFLIDPDGKVLGAGLNAGDLEPFITSFVEQPGATDEWRTVMGDMREGQRGFAEVTDPQGEPMFMAFAPIGLETGWSLGLAYPREELYEPVTSLRNQLIVLAVIFVAMAAGFVFFLTGTIIRPINQLAIHARRFATGEFGGTTGYFPDPIQIKTGDEIQDLATAFNQMAGELESDIKTLEKRVQERTRQLEAAKSEADEANRTKSRFLASMSHELRTPLNSILNFSELVADGDLGDVNAEQADALREVVSNGEHLLSLINDILDLTKIEVGMMELMLEPVDMNTVLTSVLATVKGLMKEKPTLELVTDIQADLPSLQGDKRRLRQICLNLLSNAVKFTPQGTITLSAHREDGQLHLFVKDTGVGIASEEQGMIFESFKQGAHGLQTSTGTGLGLPITRHLVEAHGGTLWLESAKGQGATFHVKLPVKDDGKTTPKADVTRPVREKRITQEIKAVLEEIKSSTEITPVTVTENGEKQSVVENENTE